MVKLMETELPLRRAGQTLEVAGHQLLLHGDTVFLDGVEVRLSPAPFAVLHALAVNPGHVVSRRDLLAALPTGSASSEHAVEMAVARLRAAIGTRVVQTVVKRGYRLAPAGGTR
jgi:uroporphyrinogen-III synthase